MPKAAAMSIPALYWVSVDREQWCLVAHCDISEEDNSYTAGYQRL